MSIELAKITDLDALLEIENECFKDPYAHDDMLYELSQNPCSKILIFKKEWGFAGFLDFWITFDSAAICQIGVKKSERRQGIGEALLLEAIKMLKEQNVEFFTLEVFPDGGGGTEHHPCGGAAVHLPAIPVQPHQQSGAGAECEAVHPVAQAVADLRGGPAGPDRHTDPGSPQPVSQQSGRHQPPLSRRAAGGDLPHLRTGPAA